VGEYVGDTGLGDIGAYICGPDGYKLGDSSEYVGDVGLNCGAAGVSSLGEAGGYVGDAGE
jgi:hypothetical protein